MKLTFAKNGIESAPKGYVRIRLTDEARSVRRLVREDGTETIEIGTGKKGELTPRKFITLCRAIVQAAKQFKARKVALQFDRTPELFKNLQNVTPEYVSSIAAQNFEMANFEFNQYKTAPKEGWNTVEEILLFGKSSKSIEEAARKGQLIGQAANHARLLSNTPSSDMVPAQLAKAARDAVKGTSATVQVLTRAQMEKLGMGAVVGVGKGSTHDPVFIILEYKGAAGKPHRAGRQGRDLRFRRHQLEARRRPRDAS